MSQNGDFMIIGTREGELLKITNDKDFDTISHENKEAIHEIKFSRDEKTLAVASYDKTITLYSISDK